MKYIGKFCSFNANILVRISMTRIEKQAYLHSTPSGQISHSTARRLSLSEKNWLFSSSQYSIHLYNGLRRLWKRDRLCAVLHWGFESAHYLRYKMKAERFRHTNFYIQYACKPSLVIFSMISCVGQILVLVIHFLRTQWPSVAFYSQHD